MVNPDVLADLGPAGRRRVDLVSVWSDGTERHAEDFQIVPYPSARRHAAARYPETNVLVPLDSVAEIKRSARVQRGDGAAGALGTGDGGTGRRGGPAPHAPVPSAAR